MNEIISLIIPWLAILAIFYFLLIRPQMQQEKKKKEILKTLKKGDPVITSSGILGTINNIEGDIVSLQIADRVVVKVLRSYISGKR